MHSTKIDWYADPAYWILFNRCNAVSANNICGQRPGADQIEEKEPDADDNAAVDQVINKCAKQRRAQRRILRPRLRSQSCKCVARRQQQSLPSRRGRGAISALKLQKPQSEQNETQKQSLKLKRTSTPIPHQANFDEGEVVWAKLQGFSWWPARVFRSQESANAFVGRSLIFPNTRGQRVCFVFFLVTEDTTVLSPDRAIRPFKPWAAQLAGVKQSARFQDAFDRLL